MSPDNHSSSNYVQFDGPKQTCCSAKCLLIACVIISGVSVCLGIAVIFIFQAIIHQELQDLLPIKNGSMSYSGWQSPPAPVYMQFWLFNVTNPFEAMAGSKAAVNQMGPFTYLEKRHKVDIQFLPNKSVTYREIRSFHFVPEMSPYSEDQLIMFVNLPTVVVADAVKNYPFLVKEIVAAYFETLDKDLFIKKSFRDLLWGYNDAALVSINKAIKPFGFHINPVVGLFVGKNNSDDGVYTVYSGEKNLDNLVKIHRWNYDKILSYWTSDAANMINGTDGTMFHPGTNNNDRLYIFSTDICRSIYLTYNKAMTVQDINLIEFQAPAEVFANVSVNPDNAGFCLPAGTGCLGSGVMNLSTCQPGVPAIVSQPHFYQADPKYIEGVEGMHPSDDCATILAVEPMTGLVMKAAKKLQINIAMHPVKGFPQVEKVRAMFLPVMWINESAVIDSDSADQFKSQLLNPITIVSVVQWFLIAFGLALLVILTLVCTIRNLQSSNDTAAIPPSSQIQDEDLIVNAET